MKRVSTTVYLDVDQLKSLKDLSGKLEVPMAAIIRRGVDQAIRIYEEKHELFEEAANG